jgi:hypothetical protein
MNSFDLAKRMKRLSMDSLSSVPPPPESLPSSFELDCTAFDDMMMSSSSYAIDCSGFDVLYPSSLLAVSSYISLASHHTQGSSSSTMSRNQCTRNLSALCNDSSLSCENPPYLSGPNAGLE